MTCNTSGLKIMCATLEDILHRPAHEVFSGPNAWVVEKLKHVADQRITLDLDDGVKVNYGKFGDLLAEVKAVSGKKATS